MLFFGYMGIPFIYNTDRILKLAFLKFKFDMQPYKNRCLHRTAVVLETKTRADGPNKIKILIDFNTS